MFLSENYISISGILMTIFKCVCYLRILPEVLADEKAQEIHKANSYHDSELGSQCK